MRTILVIVAAVVALILGVFVGKRLTRNELLGGPHTAPPKGITDPTDSAQRKAVLAYARSLTFAYDKRGASSRSSDPYGPNGEYHGQFDLNLLDTFGDSGIVAPEVNIHRSSPGDLREGRVQLRIEIIPASGRSANDVYKSVGFYPGTSYVWVDRLGPANDTARAVIVPEDLTMPIVVRKVDVYRTPQWNLAVARWTPATCWSCESQGWCH